MNQQDDVVPIKPSELMNGKFENFIGHWENFVPKVVCDKAIEYIDRVLDEDSSYHCPEAIHAGLNQFPEKELGRKDESIFLNYHNPELSKVFTQYLQACFLDYINNHGCLKQFSLISTDNKLQRTPIGGGYHQWHCENSTYRVGQRVLVWSMYLNDMPVGEAETEFLYQKRRVQPKRGDVIIWPATFTHVHRGNPVYSHNKYILTGWYVNMPNF